MQVLGRGIWILFVALTSWKVLPVLRTWGLGVLHAAPDSSGVLESLLFGERLPSAYEHAWRGLGWVHLLGLSGIHLSGICQGLDTSVRMSAFLAFCVRIRGTTRAVAFYFQNRMWIWGAFSTWTWALSNWNPASGRALALLFLRQWTFTSGMRWPGLAPLGWVLGSEALLYGWSRHWGMLHYGLALSGGYWGRTWAKTEWGKEIGMATGSWLAIVPLQLWERQPIALMTPLLSLISIPLISRVLMPFLFVAVVARSDSLLRLQHEFFERLLAEGLRISVQWPQLWVVPQSRLCLGLCGAIGFAGVLISLFQANVTANRKALTLGGLAFCAASMAPQSVHRIVQWNVGQGDAAFIKMPSMSHGMMFDAGPPVAHPWIWIERYARLGEASVGDVAISHLDQDHVGGLIGLATVLQIRKLFLAQPIQHDPRLFRRLKWPTSFTPQIQWISIRERKQVGTSVWLAAASGGTAGNHVMLGMRGDWNSGGERHRILNLGDAEGKQEAALMHLLTKESEPTVNHLWLKVSHHGSKSSSYSDVVQQMIAMSVHTTAWISVGRRNPYRHPYVGVVQRWREAGAEIHRTDQEGDLETKCDGSTYEDIF